MKQFKKFSVKSGRLQNLLDVDPFCRFLRLPLLKESYNIQMLPVNIHYCLILITGNFWTPSDNN